MIAKTEEDYLEQLVGFASVSTDLEESKKCARWCADFFESSGLRTNIVEYGGYPSIIGTSRETKKPRVLLYCHMDVVPAKTELFKLRKTKDKLLGRGVFDMKFACASYMKLLDELGDDISKYDFGIMLVFDEEIGGRNGAEALLNDGYGCEVCVLPDSGRNWSMEFEAKGPWFIRVSKTGKSAHGSMAFEGVNAAELLLPATHEIIQLREQYAYEELSLNLTKNLAGKAMNQIPNYAESVFDVRFRDQAIYQAIKHRIEQICQKHDASLETVEYGDSMNFSKDEPYMRKYLSIAEEVLGQKVPYYSSPGANDGRYFCALGIPCVIIQPKGGCMHSDTEWIEIGGMEKLTEINLRFIRECAKISQ